MFSLAAKLLSVRVDILSVTIRFWECCTTHFQRFYLQLVMWRPVHPCHRVLFKQGRRVFSSEKKPHIGIFQESSDWKLSVDFDSSLVFPSFIAITASRPYIVIYSVLKKNLIWLNWQVRVKRILKIAISTRLLGTEHCVLVLENGWRHDLLAIEVGARGYCAYNVRSCFRRLMNTKETKVVLFELTLTAIQCSFVIWINRDKNIWNEQATSTFDIPHKTYSCQK